MNIRKLILIAMTGFLLGQQASIIAAEHSYTVTRQSKTQKKLEALKFEVKMLQGKRHFYVRKGAEDALSSLKWTVIMVTTKVVMQTSGISNTVMSLEILPLIEYAGTTAIESVSYSSIWNWYIRYTMIREINTVLKKYLGKQYDFKTMSTEHAMLILAAYKKEAGLMHYLAEIYTDFCAREGARDVLDELLSSEQPSWENGWLLTKKECQNELQDTVPEGAIQEMNCAFAHEKSDNTHLQKDET